MLAGVVGPLAASVRASPDIAAAYAVSPYEIDCYGCLLLVRRTLRPTFKEVKLPTRMGRSLLIAEWRPEPDGAPIAVATAHFESLNSAPTRSKQLLAASTALAQYERAALVGDFNFDSTQNWGDWREVPPRPPRPSRDDDDDGGGDGDPVARARDALAARAAAGAPCVYVVTGSLENSERLLDLDADAGVGRNPI